MANIVQILISITAVIVSAGSLRITYLTYNKLKTLDNENHVFKYKIEKYNELMEYLVNTTIFFTAEIDKYHLKVASEDLTENQVEQKRDELYRKIEEVELTLLSKVVYLSEGVIDNVEKFIDILDRSNFINVEFKDGYKSDNANYMRDLENVGKLDDTIFEIAEHIRDDMGIDHLDKKLKSRIPNTRQRLSNKRI